MLTTEVENFPGFPDGIMGPELMMNFRSQAERFGAKFLTEKVTNIDFSSRPFKVWIRDTEYHADSVIVSTGARSLMLGLEEEQRLIGHGLSTCATCDGFFFRDQHIAVVGGGDSAIEEASFLTKFIKVTLIHRRDEFRASKIMQDRAFANPKIDVLWNHTVTKINGDDKVDGIEVTNTVDGSVSTMPVTGLFIAIGHRPNTDLLLVCLTWTMPATSRRNLIRRTPISRVSSPAVMCKTTRTVRQLLLPARVVWLPSTQSVGLRASINSSCQTRPHSSR